MILKRLCAFGLAGCMFLGCGLSAFAEDEPIIETTESEKPFDPFAPADSDIVGNTGAFLLNDMYGAALTTVAEGIGFAAAGPAGAAAAPEVLTGVKWIYGFTSAIRADYLNYKNGQGISGGTYGDVAVGSFWLSRDGGVTYHEEFGSVISCVYQGTALAGATITPIVTSAGDWNFKLPNSGFTKDTSFSSLIQNNGSLTSGYSVYVRYDCTAGSCTVTCDYLQGTAGTSWNRYFLVQNTAANNRLRIDQSIGTWYGIPYNVNNPILAGTTVTNLSGYDIHDYEHLQDTYHRFLANLAEEIGQENLDYILENLPPEPDEEEEPTDPTAELLPPIEYPDLPFQTMPSYDFEMSLPEKALASARFWFKYFGMFIERFQFVELVVTCLLIGFLFWLIL